MEIDSNKLENINVESIKSFQLSFVDNSNSGVSVSKVTDNSPTDRSKYVSNEALASILLPPHGPNNNTSKSNNSKQLLMNVNLLYNINQVID